ncbi:hypothetical protein AVEN_51888-1 [Araneus ventricosus]|uniref:Uncharacterized protein n=1 Tax=Araneus ventricosus TaxID=182803 RepID=A0A4Y2V1L5_ARAVE|nr:hypothetical protein AVEN_51888-1 [Araneus ventricosus]
MQHRDIKVKPHVLLTLVTPLYLDPCHSSTSLRLCTTEDPYAVPPIGGKFTDERLLYKMSGSLSSVEGELNAIVKEFLEYSKLDKALATFEEECQKLGKPIQDLAGKSRRDQRIQKIKVISKKLYTVELQLTELNGDRENSDLQKFG